MKRKVYIWIKNDGSWARFDEFPGDVMIECLKKGEFIEVEEDRWNKIRNDMKKNFGLYFDMLFALFVTGRTLPLYCYLPYGDFKKTIKEVLEKVNEFEKRYGVKVIFIPGEKCIAEVNKYWYGHFKLSKDSKEKLRKMLTGKN